MTANQVLFIIVYIIYLILLAATLWFLFYYSGVPAWVWSLFGIAILLAIINLLLKELLARKKVDCKSKTIKEEEPSPWGVLSLILDIFILLLILIGMILVIIFSVNVPWWVWLILGVAILFSFLAVVVGFFGSIIFLLIFSVIALILYIIGIIFYIGYADAPWWIWILVSLTLIFSILSSIFNYLSDREFIAKSCENKVTSKDVS